MDLFWRSMLTDNILLFKFLGVYLVLAYTGTAARAARTGLTVGVGLVLASWLGWVVEAHILVPAGLEDLRILAFILVVLTVALVMARFLGHQGKDFWQSGLINTAVLGIMLVNSSAGHDPLSVFLSAAGAAVGILVVLVITGSIMEATEEAYVPVPFRGAPVRLMVMGIMALIFMGFRFPI